MRRRELLMAIVVALFACGSCSDGDDSIEGSIEGAQMSPETTISTTTTSTMSVALPEEGEAWDLVVFSNSIGWYVATPYAALASEALGVEVVAHDAAIDHLRTQKAMQHLVDVAFPRLSETVRNAEIIVVFAIPDDDDWYDACGLGRVKPTGPQKVYTEADWEQYRQEQEALFAEVWRLREGLPTVMLTFDMPLGKVSDWQELGIADECIAAYEVLNAVRQQAAAAQGVKTVSLFDVFNGPNHDEDPVAKGLITTDHVHATEEGVTLIAKTFAEAGFEPTTQP